MNDKDIISYFKRSANVVQLSFAEKNRMRNRIIASPYVFYSPFWTSKKLVSVLAVLTIILSCGGASLTAASSLPGDALYPVKVNVNEEVQSFIAISPNAKAKVEVGRVKERLNEAEQLSVKGRLTDETQAIIKNNIKKHTQNVKENVVILASEQKADEANKVIDDMKTSLDQHEVVLENLSSSNANASSSVENDEHIGAIISSVIEAKAEMQNVKDVIEDINSTSTSASVDSTITTATSTASTTNNIVIDINSSSTSTTTININLNGQNFYPKTILH